MRNLVFMGAVLAVTLVVGVAEAADFWSRPNYSGGYDFYSARSGFRGSSVPNYSGGFNYYGGSGFRGTTTPNYSGGYNFRWR